MMVTERQAEAGTGTEPAGGSCAAPSGRRPLFVNELLEEQRQLGTAAAEFSAWHDGGGDAEPAQAKHYRNLIPFSKPGRGEQYAFEVNLDKCTGCKSCVAACHSLNGLDDSESWRDVGVLIGDVMVPYLQTVTTACHHCLDPACANGCPVLAYEKDAATGIVRHLDDQCIGCSYCILKCPYDVPKFNGKRGIVRKCDMCQQRLAVGEAPACVQSCPSEAIAIRVVSIDGVDREIARGARELLPGAFDSSYTRPTTRYVSAKPPPEADSLHTDGGIHLEEAHWPLAWMLVLTQMAAGMFAAAAMLPGGIAGAVSVGGLGVLFAGLLASVLHLGQPWRAWRCFLGWRKSWLSREILVFGGFFGSGALACLTGSPVLVALTALAGLAGVFCSAMVYVDTRRAFWSAPLTFTRFAGTTMMLGLAAAAAAVALSAAQGRGHAGWVTALVTTALVLRAGGLAFEIVSFTRARRAPGHPNHLSARVMAQLKAVTLRMVGGLSVSAVILGLLAIATKAPVWVAGFLLTLFASQVLERHLFFVAVRAPRMPGISLHSDP